MSCALILWVVLHIGAVSEAYEVRESVQLRLSKDRKQFTSLSEMRLGTVALGFEHDYLDRKEYDLLSEISMLQVGTSQFQVRYDEDVVDAGHFTSSGAYADTNAFSLYSQFGSAWNGRIAWLHSECGKSNAYRLERSTRDSFRLIATLAEMNSTQCTSGDVVGVTLRAGTATSFVVDAKADRIHDTAEFDGVLIHRFNRYSARLRYEIEWDGMWAVPESEQSFSLSTYQRGFSGSAEVKREEDGAIEYRLNTFASVLGGRLDLSLDQPQGHPPDFWTAGYSHWLTPSLDIARYVKGDDEGWDQGTTELTSALPFGSVGLARTLKRDSQVPGYEVSLTPAISFGRLTLALETWDYAKTVSLDARLSIYLQTWQLFASALDLFTGDPRLFVRFSFRFRS